MAADPYVVIWVLTPVEIASGFLRRWRFDGDDAARVVAESQLDEIASHWMVIDDVAVVSHRAIELLRRHHLRAADALQLAAAQIAMEEHPAIPFVTLDTRLATAARAEGFSVLPG